MRSPLHLPRLAFLCHAVQDFQDIMAGIALAVEQGGLSCRVCG